MEKISLYTETLSELLENKGYGKENQNPSLTEVLQLFDKFPNFVFGENIDLNFTKMFIDMYDIREIGAETEELFLHYLREKTYQMIIKYVPQIQMWLDNFNDLFKFTVSLNLTDTKTNSNTSQNTYFLNPANANTGISKTVVVNPETGQSTTTFTGGNLKVETLQNSDDNGEHKRVIQRDVLQSVWGKTRADIMTKIFEIRSVYVECLNSFETLFMGVY